jgi:hypothetical protein
MVRSRAERAVVLLVAMIDSDSLMCGKRCGSTVGFVED